MTEIETLLPQHSGYRNLKSFQVSQLVYDITVRFVDRYVDKYSRTRDQMVQAARSGVQNIAEGSAASATSKKTELKLTNVARASLEELRLDYEDFLRQRNYAALPPGHPALMRLKALRCSSMEQFESWIENERRSGTATDIQEHSHTENCGVKVRDCTCRSLLSQELAANGALTLINLASYFLNRQIKTLAARFETEGGFTERLYRVRTRKRYKQ
jgi:four helix bundle suffix protein